MKSENLTNLTKCGFTTQKKKNLYESFKRIKIACVGVI